MKQVHEKNFLHVFPSMGWNVRGVAQFLDDHLERVARRDFNTASLKGKQNKFWVEIDANGDVPMLRVAVPDGGEGDGNVGMLVVNGQSPMGGPCQFTIPLYAILKGFPSLDGLHSVYLHEMQGDGRALRYVGITKQRWLGRLSQHVSSAASGSRLVFHDAIRRNRDEMKVHRLVVAGCSFDAAMEEEEKLVDEFTLYQNGLNMIPGGKAGFAYLAKLGFAGRTAKERDEFMSRVIDRETVDGKPNPLCAARWAADQDYVNRVICGHGKRLDVSQVIGIRNLHSFGKAVPDIAGRLGIDNERKVRDVIRGEIYARVK